MADEIAVRSIEDTRLALASILLKPDAPNELEAVAFELNMSLGETVAMINDPQFLADIRAVTRARAALVIHTKGVESLITTIRGDDTKEARLALQALARLSGEQRPSSGVTVNISFDEMRRRAGGKAIVSADPFAIHDAVEAEFENDGELT